MLYLCPMSKKFVSAICLILAIFYHVKPVLALEIATFTTSTLEVETEVEAVTMPNIRVLIGMKASPVAVEVPEGAIMNIDDQDFNTSTTSVRVVLKNKMLVVTNGGESVAAGAVVRLVPNDLMEVLRMQNFRRVIKGHKHDYNSYRGILEFRISKNSQEIVIINELPFEEYLWGLSESAPNDPNEYVRALVVAARSYAYVRLNNKRLPYDVEATTNDQLYLGYDVEGRMPEVRLAAEVTVGEVVTYQNNSVTTPYFSRTNGHTLNWGEFHKVDRPWLKAVEAIYDKGGKRNGHGFGMSLRDAKLRVVKDNWTYKDVLGYYYSGTEIKSVY